MDQLRITEIFYSLQGEGRFAGCPSVFIRLTGCPLRCKYCDTAYAFSGGERLALNQILSRVAEYAPEYVCVTGGEPLAQPACNSLLSRLCDADYRVSLETSGALDISQVDPRVCRVLDIKTPGSGEERRNLNSNLESLGSRDQLKFVICDQADYQWAKRRLAQDALASRCEVLFSPAYGQQDPTELAEWILRDRLPVRLQFQLHKLLWGEQPGR
jgi:7-carboxy-7-deazaguanine synthase